MLRARVDVGNAPRVASHLDGAVEPGDAHRPVEHGQPGARRVEKRGRSLRGERGGGEQEGEQAVHGGPRLKGSCKLYAVRSTPSVLSYSVVLCRTLTLSDAQSASTGYR